MRPCGACIKSHARRITPLVARGEPYDPLPTCTYEGQTHAATDEPSGQTSGVPYYLQCCSFIFFIEIEYYSCECWALHECFDSL